MSIARRRYNNVSYAKDTVRVNFQAFTLTSLAGKFREIISQADIQQAHQFCSIFGFPLENVIVNALWDTGASNTVISQRIAKSFKLVAVDAALVIGVSGIMRSTEAMPV